MRFEVPQFIEVEDKIFGPFTWKQFIYLVGGVGLAVVLFVTTHILVFALFGLPLGILGILLAFYPVNNRPFSVYLESMLRYMSGTKLYLWRRQGSTTYRNASADNPAESNPSIAQNIHVPTISKSHLHSLSRNLELNSIEKR